MKYLIEFNGSKVCDTLDEAAGVAESLPLEGSGMPFSFNIRTVTDTEVQWREHALIFPPPMTVSGRFGQQGYPVAPRVNEPPVEVTYGEPKEPTTPPSDDEYPTSDR